MPFQHIIELLTHYKYGLLFPIAIVEGPIVSVIAGFLASRGLLNVFIVYPVVVIGDVIGDCIYYLIGRYGGRKFIHKWGRIIRVDENKLASVERHFENHAGKTLFMAKPHALGSVVLISAGISKMPFGKFVWYNLLGTMAKSLVLILVGYYFGQALSLIDRSLNLFGAIVAGITIVVIAYFLLRKKLWKKSL